jgi:hypothetical protein
MRHASVVLLTLILTAAFAQAQDAPKRKSGLWELKRTSTMTRDQTRVYQLCVDQASDDAFQKLAEGAQSERCKASAPKRDGSKLVIDAVCEIGKSEPSTATTHAVITGNFDSAYKIESKSTFDPPMRGKKESTSVVEAKWTGPCKPGMRAGDLILPNGTKVNPADPHEEKGDRLTSGKGHGDGKGKGSSDDKVGDILRKSKTAPVDPTVPVPTK